MKSCEGGYDGRGQVEVKAATEAAHAWKELGERAVVAEAALELESELSVLVARSPKGETAVYPPAYNHHEERILAWSLLPGPLPPQVAAQATEIARDMADALQVEGLLVVEMFLLSDGRLLVNELAPRPHNSFHATEVACLTSQFEQAVRAVCNLPLGSVEVVRPAAIVNLLGDLWLTRGRPALRAGAGDARRAAAPVRQAGRAQGPEDGTPVRGGHDARGRAGAGEGRGRTRWGCDAVKTNAARLLDTLGDQVRAARVRGGSRRTCPRRRWPRRWACRRSRSSRRWWREETGQAC